MHRTALIVAAVVAALVLVTAVGIVLWSVASDETPERSATRAS